MFINKPFLIFIILILFSFVSVGCQHMPVKCCATEYRVFVETHKVNGMPTGGVKLFEISGVDINGIDELRVFVHVMNDSYATKPFPSNSYMTITAYHGIGTGSWAYHTEKFTRKYTSEFHGYTKIPVIGNITRIAVFGYNMPNVELKVDMAGQLVR